MALPKQGSWLVAAWPGLGSVGLGAASFLIDALKAQPIEELSASGPLEVSGVTIEKGLMLPIETPRTVLYHWANPQGPDLHILTADSQPMAKAFAYGLGLLNRLPQDIRRVVTFAAAPRAVRGGENVKVWATASHPDMVKDLQTRGIQILDQGQISGMNGLFPGIAAMHGLEALCLLGELPYELAGAPNPRSAAAVLQVFSELSGVGVDVAPLLQIAQDWEERMGERDEEGLLELPTEFGESADVPDDVLDNIEQLFAEAQVRRERANDLKSVLDRWKLFPKYEDRFLDLFRPEEF